MSLPLMLIVTVIYVAVAIDEFLVGKPHMGIVFLGYAFANCGLMWGMR
jgi:hypothetical protein